MEYKGQVLCPFCTKRVNDWEIAFEKTLVINGKRCHRSCLRDQTPSAIVAKLGPQVPSRFDQR
jgi:hypothetical protein